MSHCTITWEIAEYQPNSFDFETFGFIFCSDRKDFEGEINYRDKNILMHKTNIKKEWKYGIKVTKNGAFIGFTEFTLPTGFWTKHQEEFAKHWNITMTDQTKRLLFGGSTNTMLKIMVNATVVYREKADGLQQSHSLPKKDMASKLENDISWRWTNKKISNEHPGVVSVKHVKNSSNNMSHVSQNSNRKKKKNNSKIISSAGKAVQKTNMNSMGNSHNANAKKHNTGLISSTDKSQWEDPEFDPNDISVLDEVLESPLKNDNLELIAKVSNYIKNNPIEDLNNITDEALLLNKTKDNLIEFSNYQAEYYSQVGEAVALNNVLRELWLKCNEKLRSIMKKRHRWTEQRETHDIRKDIIVNINKNNNTFVRDMLPNKRNEINIIKKVFAIAYSKSDGENNTSLKKQTELKSKEKEDLLVKALKNVTWKHGPLLSLFMKNKCSETEKETIGVINRKYDLPTAENDHINEEENEEEHNAGQEPKKEVKSVKVKTKNVQAKVFDSVDVKLNDYLDYFYSKRKVINIPFIKRSQNNYEYGTQKIMVKIEGETIRVRTNKGYLLWDTFIELNAPIEDTKLKNKMNKEKGRKGV